MINNSEEDDCPCNNWAALHKNSYKKEVKRVKKIIEKEESNRCSIKQMSHLKEKKQVSLRKFPVV